MMVLTLVWGGCISCPQFFMFPKVEKSCCNKSGQCERPEKKAPVKTTFEGIALDSRFVTHSENPQIVDPQAGEKGEKKGAPVVMVANTTQLGPCGIITVGKKIGSPKEIEGKSIGAVPGGADYVAMLAVLKQHNIAETSYRMVSVEAASKTA